MKKIFIITAILGLVLSSCTKDQQNEDPAEFEYSNTFTVNDITESIYYIWYDIAHECGTRFIISDEQDRYLIELRVPKELYNQEFNLLSESVQTECGWYFDFYDDVNGLNSFSVGGMGETPDISSGVFYSNKISEGEYEIRFEISFKDGFTVKGDYKGEISEMLWKK